jgi:hypothetical protein
MICCAKKTGAEDRVKCVIESTDGNFFHTFFTCASLANKCNVDTTAYYMKVDSLKNKREIGWLEDDWSKFLDVHHYVIKSHKR